MPPRGRGQLSGSRPAGPSGPGSRPDAAQRGLVGCSGCSRVTGCLGGCPCEERSGPCPVSHLPSGGDCHQCGVAIWMEALIWAKQCARVTSLLTFNPSVPSSSPPAFLLLPPPHLPSFSSPLCYSWIYLCFGFGHKKNHSIPMFLYLDYFCTVISSFDHFPAKDMISLMPLCSSHFSYPFACRRVSEVFPELSY